MLEKSMKTVLEFFDFDDQLIVDLEYMITQSEVYGIKDKVRQHIDSFNPAPNEPLPIFYKKVFLSEFSWRFCELVCGEFYPDIAVTQLEDFCLYHHNIWTEREDYNPYYVWFLQNDLRKMTMREAVEKNYKDIGYHYDKYLVDGRETLFRKGLK